MVDTRLLDDGKDNNTVIAEGLAALIAERFGRSMAELQLPVAIAIEAADGVLKFAFRRNDRGDQIVVDEAKALIKGYLSTRLGEPE